MFFTATQRVRLLVGPLLLWVISKRDKAGIHLFEKFKSSTLPTDGELLYSHLLLDQLYFFYGKHRDNTVFCSGQFQFENV